MPKRKGRILAMVQLLQMGVKIAWLKPMAFEVTRGSQCLGVAFATAFHLVAQKCYAILEEVMELWMLQAPPTSPTQSAESLIDDEL